MVQGVCYSLKRIGGRGFPTGQAFDCDKFVCMDAFTTADCLIYSFGIHTSWEFEDTMDALNCTVHAFDPSVTFPPTRGQSTYFQKLGVGAARDQRRRLETLATLLADNQHNQSRVFYLKVDIEGMELEALPEWLESGALEHVEQLAMELHLPPIHQQRRSSILLLLLLPRFPWLLRVLQQLYRLGFRLVSHEVNTARKKTDAGYHSLLEVVLMKDTVWAFLDAH